jgi:hypothetical protein
MSITGDKALDAKLKDLELRTAKRIARKAINKGLTQIARGQRAAAPTKRIKGTVGSRNKKNRKTGLAEAKVGMNVGKKLTNPKRMPHAHLLALGTSERTTRSGASRGRMPAIARDFIRAGTHAALGAAKTAIETSLRTDLAKRKL